VREKLTSCCFGTFFCILLSAAFWCSRFSSSLFHKLEVICCSRFPLVVSSSPSVARGNVQRAPWNCCSTFFFSRCYFHSMWLLPSQTWKSHYVEATSISQIWSLEPYLLVMPKSENHLLHDHRLWTEVAREEEEALDHSNRGKIHVTLILPLCFNIIFSMMLSKSFHKFEECDFVSAMFFRRLSIWDDHRL